MTSDDHIERRLKLRDLRILMAVIECGTMGKAARRLAVSQPVISKAVSDLETSLNVRLLDRNPHGIVPTLYGRALIKRGLAIFDEMRECVAEIEFLTDPSVGQLRIGCTEPQAAGLVSDVSNSLSRQYPGITFEVVQSDSGSLHRALEERRVELAISRMYAPANDKRLHTEILYYDSIVVAAGLQNPWARRRKVVLADLVDDPWTLPPDDTLLRASVAGAFHVCGLQPPKSVVITASLSMRISLLATGRFLSVEPAVALHFLTRHAEIKALPVELPTTRRPVAITSLKNRALSPLAELFVERVRATVKPIARVHGGGC